MSRTDFVWNSYYAPHLFPGGDGFKPNNSKARTRAIESVYFNALSELAANRFKWLNLPDTIDPRFLEMTLLRNGLSVFYYDTQFSRYLALRGSPSGPLNYDDNPITFMVTGNQFISKTLSAIPSVANVGGTQMPVREQCVPIWANYNRTADIRIVSLYASKLADLDRTIEINGHNARRSKLIVVDDNGRMTARAINREIDEGAAAIEVSTQGLAMAPVALDMGIDPDGIEKLDILRVRQFNMCMTLLGINSANQDKKERLVASEVDANDEQVEGMKSVALNSRKLAAKRINERYGLTIDVKFDQDVTEQADTVFKALFSEVVG